jgi:hypothetical protein
METDDLRVDGNAVAGLLREVFALELTGGRARCDNCGQIAELGAHPVYGQGPGVVLRCEGCDGVMVVVVHGGGRYWLGLTGTTWLEIPDEPLH